MEEGVDGDEGAAVTYQFAGCNQGAHALEGRQMACSIPFTQTGYCGAVRARLYCEHTSVGDCLPTTCGLLFILLLGIAIMYKVLRSYSKKAERKHEVTGARHDDASAGQVVPVHGNGGQVGAWHGGGQARGFSESSSYETREHYERKVQRVKKTRSERERSRNRGGNRVCSNFHFYFQIQTVSYSTLEQSEHRDVFPS